VEIQTRRHQQLPAEDRRAQIASAALRCIERDGYVSLTARKIAQEAGLSLGHLTYHFHNMDAILAATYRHASQKLHEATTEDLDRSTTEPLDRLRAFIATGFGAAFLTREYLRVRVDLWSAALAHPEIASTELALYQRYRQRLAEVLADFGPASAEHRAIVIDTIMATLDGLWLDYLRRGDQAAIRNGLKGCAILAETLLKPQL
jgi:TetR/AcrR family transcriptional repressor of bet genes